MIFMIFNIYFFQRKNLNEVLLLKFIYKINLLLFNNWFLLIIYSLIELFLNLNLKNILLKNKSIYK